MSDPNVDQYLAHVRARCVEAGVDRWDDSTMLALAVFAEIVDSIGGGAGSGPDALVAMVGAIRMVRDNWHPEYQAGSSDV